MRRDQHTPVRCGSGGAYPRHQAIVALPERDALSLLGGGLLGGNLFAGPTGGQAPVSPGQQPPAAGQTPLGSSAPGLGGGQSPLGGQSLVPINKLL